MLISTGYTAVERCARVRVQKKCCHVMNLLITFLCVTLLHVLRFSSSYKVKVSLTATGIVSPLIDDCCMFHLLQYWQTVAWKVPKLETMQGGQKHP